MVESTWSGMTNLERLWGIKLQNHILVLHVQDITRSLLQVQSARFRCVHESSAIRRTIQGCPLRHGRIEICGELRASETIKGDEHGWFFDRSGWPMKV